MCDFKFGKIKVIKMGQNKEIYIDEERKIIFTNLNRYFKECINEAKEKRYTEISYKKASIYSDGSIFFELMKQKPNELWRARLFKKNTYWTIWRRTEKEVRELVAKYIIEGLEEKERSLIAPERVVIEKFIVKK